MLYFSDMLYNRYLWEVNYECKKIRLEKGYTVPKLSEYSGLSVRTIENIEKRGQSTVANAIKLADALGVTLDELCRDTTDSITK